MGHLLAVDAGTGSVRAVLFAEDGRPLGSAARRWSPRPDPSIPGAVDFDARGSWPVVADCIGTTLAAAGASGSEVGAVSASGFRSGFVLLDDSRRELWACGAMDARAGEQVRALRAADPALERRAYLASGQTFAMSAVPRLLWVRERLPEVLERAAALEMASDWVLTRLCGAFGSDPSNASTTGLLSLGDRRWATDLAEIAGIGLDVLPPISEPGTVVGEVGRTAAAETGLAPGTPVVTGGGDAQLAALGLGVTAPGATAVIGGSFWQQLVTMDAPRTDEGMRVRVTCHAAPGLWLADALVVAAGLTVRWFLDAFCGGAGAFARLEAEAAGVPPGSGGALALLSNAMNYGNWRHAAPAFVGFPLDDAATARAALFRALLENAALVARANLEVVDAALGTGGRESVAFGGGAASSPLWRRIVADVLGIPVRVPAVTETTALGAAMCAGVGVGVFGGTVDAADALVGWERTEDPDPAVTRVYDEVFDRWKRAYAEHLHLADEGVTTPMWTPPGS